MNPRTRAFDPIGRLRRLRGDQKPEAPDIRKAFTRLASTEDGRKFLEWLWEKTYGRTLPLDAPDGALREMEAGRRLFDQINNLIEEPRVSEKRTGRNAVE